MLPFQDYILVIGAIQGILLFLVLATDARVSNASRVLGVLCLFLALFLCSPLVIASGSNSVMFWLLGWIFYLPASIGGLSYLYCRNAIRPQKLSLSHLVHLTPLLFCYVLVADYIIFDPEKLARWIQGGSYSSFRLVLSEYIMFAQALFYFPFTLRLISRYKRQANDKFANFNPNTFRWLALFMMLSLAVWTLKALFAFINDVPLVIYYGSDVMIVVLIYVVGVMQWRNPQLFTVVPGGEDGLTNNLYSGTDTSDKQGGVLDADSRADLLALVTKKVESQELFRDKDLTLSRLADETGLKVHHLSEVLNQQAGQNFYQFINSYRVEYVCSRFRKDTKSRVLDISLDAGFSSKSTFNSIFKKFKGMTPTEYRKTLK